VSKLSEMLDTNSGLGAEFYPNSTSSCLRVGVRFGGKGRVQQVHLLRGARRQAHKSSAAESISIYIQSGQAITYSASPVSRIPNC
jgi:hypothetical protein